MSNLFDPQPLTRPGMKTKEEKAAAAAKRKAARALEESDVTVVALVGKWKFLANNRGVHYTKSTSDNGTVTGLCDVSGTPLTVEPGTAVAACRHCLDKGAPASRLGGAA